MMKEEKKYVALTSLKGLFIFMIVFYHMGGNFGRILGDISQWCYDWGGYLGNTFFYMVSGFLIACGYQERIANGDITIVNYMMRRISKIFPLYFITNMFRLGLNIVGMGISALKFDEFLRVISMTASGWVTNIVPYNDPSYFVCVLIVCYIFYYYVAMISGKNKNIYFLLLVFFVMYGRSLKVLNLNIPFMRSGVGNALCCFFLGVMLHELVISSYDNLKRTILFCGNILTALFIMLSSLNGISSTTSDVSMVFCFLLIPTVILNGTMNKIVERICSVKPFIMLGKLSMSLYLVHGPWIALYNVLRCKLQLINLNLYVQYCIILLILFAISFVSHLWVEPYIEKKFLKIFAKRKE